MTRSLPNGRARLNHGGSCPRPGGAPRDGVESRTRGGAIGDRPHILGIDDGAFDKAQRAPVRLIAVMTEGSDLVETVAIREFPVDGDDATGFLADWIASLRCRPSLQAVVLGGITIAGLGIVDIRELSGRLALPVLVWNRKDPARSELARALRAAGLVARTAVVDSTPRARKLGPGCFLAWAGTDAERAAWLLAQSSRKSQAPEAVRIAHLVGKALADGESRGRA